MKTSLWSKEAEALSQCAGFIIQMRENHSHLDVYVGFFDFMIEAGVEKYQDILNGEYYDTRYYFTDPEKYMKSTRRMAVLLENNLPARIRIQGGVLRDNLFSINVPFIPRIELNPINLGMSSSQTYKYIQEMDEALGIPETCYEHYLAKLKGVGDSNIFAKAGHIRKRPQSRFPEAW